MMKKIPTIIEIYDEDPTKPLETMREEGVIYEPVAGETIHVTFWVRYPHYDFIFGVPTKENPHYQKEFGYFAFRKNREGRLFGGWSIYVDQTELEEMKFGWSRVLEVSERERVEEWKKHNETVTPFKI